MPTKHAVLVNRDLLMPLTADYFRGVKQWAYYVFSVDRNTAGYSHDVNG